MEKLASALVHFEAGKREVEVVLVGRCPLTAENRFGSGRIILEVEEKKLIWLM
jgi:hypothetical protein